MSEKTLVYIISVALTLAVSTACYLAFRREGTYPPAEWWIATGTIVLSNAVTNAVLCFG